jgi:hypothetical protein
MIELGKINLIQFTSKPHTPYKNFHSIERKFGPKLPLDRVEVQYSKSADFPKFSKINI